MQPSNPYKQHDKVTPPIIMKYAIFLVSTISLHVLQNHKMGTERIIAYGKIVLTRATCSDVSYIKCNTRR